MHTEIEDMKSRIPWASWWIVSRNLFLIRNTELIKMKDQTSQTNILLQICTLISFVVDEMSEVEFYLGEEELQVVKLR